MKWQLAVLALAVCVVASTVGVWATDAEVYLASDKGGQNRVTDVQEGDSVWIVVYDPDENIDCDVRDKIWTDVKIMDPKTGAYIVWMSYFDENGSLLPGGGCPCEYDQVGYVPYKGHWPGNSAGWLGGDYLEETGADTGLFVSSRAFQIGSREDYNDPFLNTHVVDNALRPEGWPYDFQWGGYLYSDSNIMSDDMNINGDDRCFMRADLNEDEVFDDSPTPELVLLGEGPAFPSEIFEWARVESDAPYLLGRFENMDTLVVMYQDQNDETDVALGLAKIIDHEATISWSQEIYKDANSSATITVVDPDENLNCNEVEYVPVFILVNPGSWNPVRIEDGGDEDASPTTFCALLHTGGVAPVAFMDGLTSYDLGDPLSEETSGYAIRWYNIYSNDLPWSTVDPAYADGAYYVEYPTPDDTVDGDLNPPVTFFNTSDADGFCRVSFHAQETGVNTGVFQLNLNSILEDLGFDSLLVRDVLVAYYLDPNDFDDFKLATAYIEEWNHSITSFTDADRNDQEEYWLGRDPIYVQVIDANANVDPCCPEQVVVHLCDPHQEDDSEYWILDETSSNSPVFISMSGMELVSVWDALGIGFADSDGGYQLALDNWRFEAFNEDDVMVRYNDVYYTTDETGLGGLGDLMAIGDDALTPFPPRIDRIRVANDVSFDMMHIGDTQVFADGTVNMYFLDRQGNRVSGYVNSDCVFVEVIDPDQDEDQMRRERIDAYWDVNDDWGPGIVGGGNAPFGPFDFAVNHDVCGYFDDEIHPVNALLGDTNIFASAELLMPMAKLYVLNPRNGRWAAVDLMETGIDTGVFRSVICVDLVGVYECTPTLGVLPGDTILAVYQDPSNHSDSAWISIKVGIGGGGTPATQASSTMFADETGVEVTSYTDADMVYVKVVDPSHAGATVLLDAVEIAGETYDVEPLAGATSDTFITEGLALDLVAG